jgi:hypothetical protein
VQLFSAHARTGLEEAQGVLAGWLGAKEKTPMTSGEATGAD